MPKHFQDEYDEVKRIMYQGCCAHDASGIRCQDGDNPCEKTWKCFTNEFRELLKIPRDINRGLMTVDEFNFINEMLIEFPFSDHCCSVGIVFCHDQCAFGMPRDQSGYCVLRKIRQEKLQ